MDKLLISLICIPILSIIFTFSETGRDISQPINFLVPSILAITLVLSLLWERLKRYYLISGLVLLVIMVLLYLGGQIESANWVGSLGFGILLMTTLSYLPTLIRKGNIDQF